MGGASGDRGAATVVCSWRVPSAACEEHTRKNGLLPTDEDQFGADGGSQDWNRD